jgi:hypothetical protein
MSIKYRGTSNGDRRFLMAGKMRYRWLVESRSGVDIDRVDDIVCGFVSMI